MNRMGGSPVVAGYKKEIKMAFVCFGECIFMVGVGKEREIGITLYTTVPPSDTVYGTCSL